MYSGDTHKSYRPYYTCYSRAKTTASLVKDPNCKSLAIAVCDLDYIVVSEIRKLIMDKEYIYNLIHKNANPDQDNLINALNDKIKELDKQERRLLDLYQLGTLPIESINDRINSLNRERNAIRKEIDALRPKNKMSVEDAIYILNTENDIFNYGSLEQRKAFISLLIDYIAIDESQICIHWKFA